MKPDAGTHAILSCEAIDAGYRPGTPVLRGVSAGFRAGTLTAVIGPNGCGKSTLLRVLLGVLTPSRGTITLDGVPIERVPRARRAANLAYVPQRSSVAFAFTTREVVALGRYASGHEALPAPRTQGSRAVDEALRHAQLEDKAHEPFGSLSAGQQQRATLARALAQLGVMGDEQPSGRVLLADEPVSAMDPYHALRTMRTLGDLARKGVAVVVVLHDLSLALRDADEVLALRCDGTVAAQGPVRSTLTPELLRELFGVTFLAMANPADPALPLAFVPVDSGEARAAR